MTYNTKYIARVFSLILIVEVISLFAMEKQTEVTKTKDTKLIEEKYKKYGKPYLDCVHKPLVIIRTLNNRKYIKTFHGTVRTSTNTKHVEAWYSQTTSPLGTPKKLSQYYNFSIFIEAVKDLRVNLDYIFSILDGLKVSPNTAVSESRESTTKSISSIGTSFIGCVVRLIVKKEKIRKSEVKILEDLLLRCGGDPDRLVFYKTSITCRLTPHGFYIYFKDGENNSYGPKNSFFTPQEILNKFKKQRGLSMNQNATIGNIDSLFVKTRGQLALESVNNQQK